MELKELVINDVEGFFNTGQPTVHLFKFVMWYSKSEENLMKLSHQSHEEFKSVIPKIAEVIITDFKKHFNIIPKTSDEYKRFGFRRDEIFDKRKRLNVHLTVSDYDLLMDYLDVEYRKFIGNVKFEKPIDNKSIQPQKKEGCYIATMVYKDYNHPYVLELREFRDKTLSQSTLGRIFIKIYYKFSPTLVQKIEHNNSLNLFIKKCLNKVVEKLKERKDVW